MEPYIDIHTHNTTLERRKSERDTDRNGKMYAQMDWNETDEQEPH